MSAQKSAVARRAERRRRDGFDRSRVTHDGYVKVSCSQCEALVINGVACHEQGCPNIRSIARCRRF